MTARVEYSYVYVAMWVFILLSLQRLINVTGCLNIAG